MRLGAILILGCLCMLAGGAGPAERDQVLAATASAEAQLFDQVTATPLGRNLTVADFLSRTRSVDQMQELLQGAEQIGGPRWVGATCQVALEMPATRVIVFLRQMAAAHPDETPIAADAIDRAARGWCEVIFSATGSATSSSALPLIVPPASDERWRRVSPASRGNALAAARDDAVRRLVDGIRPVVLGRNSTVGDALGDEQSKPVLSLSQWLTQRPVSRVKFLPDMEVEVWLSVPPDGLFDELRAAISQQERIALPQDDAGWQPVRQDFLARLPRPCGRAMVAPDGVTPTTQPAIRLPRAAPQWVDAQWDDVTGNAPPGGSKLRCARQAENDARLKLAARLASLPLDGTLTLGEAARRDRPRFGAALDRIVSQARIIRTEYHDDGSASIVLFLDLRDAWDVLRQSAGGN